jgi:hypothetical protein
MNTEQFDEERVFAALDMVAPSHFGIHGWNALPETKEVMRRHGLAYRHVQSQYNTFVASARSLHETVRQARACLHPLYRHQDHLALTSRIESSMDAPIEHMPTMRRTMRQVYRIGSELSVGEWVTVYGEPANSLPSVCSELTLLVHAHARALVYANRVLDEAEHAIWALERGRV